MADWVGRQLGNYQLTRLLGEGGFAEVYLGEHVHLGTQAAIKVLHTQLGGEDIDKFRVEARTIARLQHPNIVRVLDFGIENKKPFLVMDFAPNGTLRNKYTRGQRIPLSSVASYVKQVAEALQCAHDEKMVHRDVKPENMLVGRRNEILLSDFGIATATQTSRQNTQDITGTVAYMSPEQIQGKPRSASDQYSLAIVAYEWLSGERPFHGSFTEIAVQHTVVPPPPLREKVPSLSSDVERVIMIALEKDPAKRFSSVQAFATALEQASKGNAPIEVKLQQKALEPTVVVPPVVAPVKPLKSTKYVMQTAPTQYTPQKVYAGHSKKINKVVWSPNGYFIASTSDDNTSHILDTSSMTCYVKYDRHSHWVLDAAWSPRGNRVASASDDKTVQIWNVSPGGDVLIYRGHSHWVYAVKWSTDERVIASVSADKTLQVWDTVTANKILSYSIRSSSVTLFWSPNQKYIVTAGDMVQIWSIFPAVGSVLTYQGHVDITHTVAWSPDGKYIASGGADKTVQIWNASTGETIFTYRGHTDTVREVSWSPDGKRIASGDSDMMVQVWDVATGSRICNLQHRSPVYTVAWSPNGKYIASGGDDKHVLVWVAPQ